MGVFGELFGFDGRISRLGYLWRALLGGALIGVGGGLIGLALVFALPSQSILGDGEWMRWLTTGALLIGMWNGLALASRRLRDIGLEPTHVVPIYVALWVVNEALLAPLDGMRPQTYGAFEDGWTVLQLALPVLLLVWPGRRARPPATSRARYEPPVTTRYVNWRASGD